MVSTTTDGGGVMAEPALTREVVEVEEVVVEELVRVLVLKVVGDGWALANEFSASWSSFRLSSMGQPQVFLCWAINRVSQPVI